MLVDHLLIIKKDFKKFKETGDSEHIYQNELHKACFPHDMAYRGFKDLTRRTASDIILCVKAFNIAKNAKYKRYQRSLGSIVYKCFHKKSSDGAAESESMQNRQLAKKLH